MRVDIRTTVTGLEKLSPAQVKEGVREWAREGAPLVQGEMVRVIRGMQKSYGRTGELAGSVRITPGPSGFSVGPEAPHAVFFVEGTRPHEIRPRNAQALAFPPSGARMGTRRAPLASGKPSHFSVFRFGGKETRGGVIFAKVVHHPGTDPHDVPGETARRIEGPLTELLDKKLAAKLGGG